jgi:hypothetical protein
MQALCVADSVIREEERCNTASKTIHKTLRYCNNICGRAVSAWCGGSSEEAGRVPHRGEDSGTEKGLWLSGGSADACLMYS